MIPIVSDPNRMLEITVIFTKECNLKCDFCFILKNKNIEDTKLTVDGIRQKYQMTKELIEKSSSSRMSIVLMGGELFMDSFSDEIFNEYYTFVKNLRELCERLGKSIQFSFMTNLVFKKIDRFVELVKKTGAEVHCSYDFYGRFTNDALTRLWMKNVSVLEEKRIKFFVAMVATKQNLEVITSKDIRWEYIYSRYPVYVGYYEKVNATDKFSVSEEEYSKFLLFLRKNYPKEMFVTSLLEQYNLGARFCVQSIIVSNNESKMCCDHKIKELEFVKNRRCFACKHFSQCPKICPRVFSSHRLCVLKSLFDEETD